MLKPIKTAIMIGSKLSLIKKVLNGMEPAHILTTLLSTSLNLTSKFQLLIQAVQ